MYVIGVDAGGTKTLAAIVDKTQKILFYYTSGPANIAVNYDEAKKNIVEAVQHCLDSPIGSLCQSIVLGAAGIESGDNKQRLYTELVQQFPLPIIMVNDAELAFYAFFQRENGILAIAGTGSIFLGRKNNQFTYVGGWGHLLGDEGSGYDIGLKALKWIAAEYDGGKLHSAFCQSIAEQFNIHDSSQLKQFVYSGNKSQIASLSLAVYQLAQHGDQTALSLLKEAGTLLAIQTMKLIKRMQLPSPLHIGCKGSLFEKNEILQQFYQDALRMYDDKLVVTYESVEAVIGAVTVWEDGVADLDK